MFNLVSISQDCQDAVEVLGSLVLVGEEWELAPTFPQFNCEIYELCYEDVKHCCWIVICHEVMEERTAMN